jgi:hypothetical protein
MQETAQLVLMYVALPLLVLAGLADWWCHRRTRIERTSGLPENLYHWLLFGEMGLAILAVALLEVNAAILLLVFAAFLAHELTTWLELHYTVPLRQVGPGEQMVHSFLEVVPLLVLALLVVAHWDQARSLLDESMPDFQLRWKEQPWPASYLLGGAVVVTVCNLVPLAEESWRCWRSRRMAGDAVA